MVLPGLQLGFIEATKTTILSGFAALPYLLVIFTGFFGGLTGNLGLAILFLGQIFLVPSLQFILSLLRTTDFAVNTLRLGSVKPLEPLCSLVPDITRKGNFPAPAISDWIAQVAFFFGFLLTNGYVVYNLEPATGASPDASEEQKKKSAERQKLKVENRQAHAAWSLLLSVIVFIGMIGLHYNITKCETSGSLSVGLVLYIALGIAWFQFASSCGIKQTDIFGIVGKIHTIAAGSDEYPNVCVPIKNNTCNPECNRATGKVKDCPCAQASECASNTCTSGKCA